MTGYTLSLNGDPSVIAATGVVVSVPWTMSATDGTNQVSISDVLVLEPGDPKAPGFVAFADLTPEIVLGWVSAALNLPLLAKQLDALLAAQAAPVPVPMALPGVDKLQAAPSVAVLVAATIAPPAELV